MYQNINDIINTLDREKLLENPYNYNNGWNIDNNKIEVIHAFNCSQLLNEESNSQVWDDSLEEICEDASKNHFIDVYERKQVLSYLNGYIEEGSCVCDFGASSGYMVEDLKNAYKNTFLIAGDLYERGLYYSFKHNPDILHIQMNICEIPLLDMSMDAAVCLNVLEHIDDDVSALKEMYRVMKPGGVVCLVVPYGENLYDYYDESIFHKRRYASKELHRKVEQVGFVVLKENFLGTFLFIPFAIKKRLNRYQQRRMTEEEKRIAFQKDNNSTMNSHLGKFIMKIEELQFKRMKFSFGIRNILLVQKPY